MAYIKINHSMVGRQVRLTEEKKSISGYFEIGTVVTITDMDERRGYEFTDNAGNRISEAGFCGFNEIEHENKWVNQIVGDIGYEFWYRVSKYFEELRKIHLT